MQEQTGQVGSAERTTSYLRVGAGPPLVLINGFTATKRDWDPAFLESLAGHREVIAPDNRGMGDSDGGDSPFTVADVSADPMDQASAVISVLFPRPEAAAIDARFGEIVAAARAALDPVVVRHQQQAMDAWHADGTPRPRPRSECPTLIATGMLDVVIPPGNSLALATEIAGSWLARFERGGHAFMAQYPRRLAGLIEAFLAAG